MKEEEEREGLQPDYNSPLCGFSINMFMGP